MDKEQLLDHISHSAEAHAMGAPYRNCYCVDCGVNTAATIGTGFRRAPAVPGMWEMYWVKDKVWAAAGMGAWHGSLCICCIERRLGRRLRPKDFDHSRNENKCLPEYVTPLLRARRGY